MTLFNSIQSYLFSDSLGANNLTFLEQITLIKTELERSLINIIELRRQLKDLTHHLGKKSAEDRREAFKVLNQVKDKIQISGNDWENNFKSIERKFIQSDLINWGTLEARGKINQASKRILKVFDYNLIKLDMDHLKLDSLPKSVEQLSQMQTLHLSGNQLESLSESFGKLSQLQELKLNNNRIRSLPESFELLSQLQILYLSYNQLESLPESFGQLSQLKQLYLAH